MMERSIQKEIKKSNKLLLHACCAPCATVCLERLLASKHKYDLTVFFYNPNITTEEEYNARLVELIRLCSIYDVLVVDGGYSPNKFNKLAVGHENDEECGPRCKMCYALRLEAAGSYAAENGFDLFATTLTLSPFKDSDVINRIGRNVSILHSIDYLATNFKEDSGYERSIELSHKFNLYRQSYCGCEFSKNYEDLEANK